MRKVGRQTDLLHILSSFSIIRDLCNRPFPVKMHRQEFLGIMQEQHMMMEPIPDIY